MTTYSDGATLAGKILITMMPRLEFSFSADKFIQAIVFFSHAGVRDLTKMKIHKLLYFADKLHLLRFGRPIIGDRYFALEYGPVASQAQNRLDSAAETLVEQGPDETAALFAGFAKMVPGARYPVVVAVGDVDAKVFSRSDLEILSEVVQRYGQMTAAALSQITHREAAYREANRHRAPDGSEAMPYETFFLDEETDVLGLALAEQEDRDFVAAIRAS